MTLEKVEGSRLSLWEKVYNIPRWVTWFVTESKKFLSYKDMSFLKRAWFWVRVPFKTIGFVYNTFRDS
jgi:hypothetical protein